MCGFFVASNVVATHVIITRNSRPLLYSLQDLLKFNLNLISQQEDLEIITFKIPLIHICFNRYLSNSRSGYNIVRIYKDCRVKENIKMCIKDA